MARLFVAPLLLALLPASAAADTKTCVAAHASAQREVKAGRLKQAAQSFTTCGSDNACPEQLRAECAELLEKVKASVPTVIFSVIDGKGADVSSVKVSVDDTLLLDGLDGRPVELDPGKYHFRFVLPDGLELSVDALVREGEKNRVVGVRAPEEKAPLASTPHAATGPTPVEVPPKPAPASTPVGAWIATGVAVVGFGTFGTFAMLGNSDKNKLNDCAPSCAESEHDRRDSLKTKFLIADVGLGVGAVSAIVAGILFLSSGPSEADRRAKKEENRGLSFNATTSGGQLLLRGRF